MALPILNAEAAAFDPNRGKMKEDKPSKDEKMESSPEEVKE